MRIYTVAEFLHELTELLEEMTVTIEGEISGFRIVQNRFVWFSLVDDKSVLPCFLMAFQLAAPLQDGMHVRVVGSPTIFNKSGRFVFRPRNIEIVGEGSLKKAYELLKAKLAHEGLFEEARKRPLPRFPQQLGLITSKDAAAYTDVLKILSNRWRGLEIFYINVQVQGTQAIGEIVGALQQLNAEYSYLDCIILTRGGGSLEDLQAFNSEEVARAIFASKIPVVGGVGHERDITLCDLVADVRASTPSNAAELVVPDKRDVMAELSSMMKRCVYEMGSLRQHSHKRLDDFVHFLEEHVKSHSVFFHDLQQRLTFQLERFSHEITLKRKALVHAVELVHSYHPASVLQRGYTITTNAKGEVLKSVHLIHLDEQLNTTFHDGTVGSVVKEKKVD